uniref:Uncharacterized protein n=1 Tax=Cyprinodon variegatus TaxID=28743 RepID=A0A3Q2DH94_CYPVA
LVIFIWYKSRLVGPSVSRNMGPSATPVTPSADNMFKSNGLPVNLPKHSYWMDFWAFVLFDVALFLFVYFIVP